MRIYTYIIYIILSHKTYNNKFEITTVTNYNRPKFEITTVTNYNKFEITTNNCHQLKQI